MILDTISQYVISFRRNIIFSTFIFLILVSSFFSGEWSKWLQAIIFVSTFLLIFYMVLVAQPQIYTGRTRKLVSNPHFFLFIFLGVALLTSFFSIDRYDSFSQLFLLTSYLFIYFASYHFFRRWRYLYLMTNFIFFVSILAAVIALVMFANQASPRAGGLLFNANALGSYLLLGLPVGFTVMMLYRHSRLRHLYFLGFLVIAVVFLLTYSYTAWVAFIVPFYLLVRHYRKIIFTRRNVALFLLVILVGFTFLVVFRYQNSQDFIQAVSVHQAIPFNNFIISFSQRLYIPWSAGEILRDYPVAGTGLNTFQSVYARYAHTIIEQPRYVHNYYLQTAAETGIFGFLALVVFLILLLRRSYQVVKREPDRVKKNVLLGLSLGVAGSVIHALFDFGWQFPAVFILFWIECGMIMAWFCQLYEGAVQNEQSSGPSPVFKAVRAFVLVVALVILVRGVTLFIGAYYADQAVVAMKDGETRAALSYYERSLQFDPDPALLAAYVGDKIRYPFLLESEDYVDMERRLKNYLERNPEDYLAHWTQGRVYFVQNKFTEAEAEYLQAIAYNPIFRTDIYYDLAFLYFKQGEYEETKKVIFSILEKYPPGIQVVNPNLHTQLAFLNLLLGETYLEQGNTEFAKKFYNKALILKPDFELAKNKLKELE